MFQNPDMAAIRRLLESVKTIAVVGLSDNPARPSHGVAAALQHFGYRIIPVNPVIKETLGEKAVADLDHLGEALRPGERVDLVDVFRKSEDVSGIVDDCIRLKVPAIWLQDGVIDEAAALRAQQAGITVVMDRCIFRDHRQLF
jgi:predicted CoA-binding protein